MKAIAEKELLGVVEETANDVSAILWKLVEDERICNRGDKLALVESFSSVVILSRVRMAAPPMSITGEKAVRTVRPQPSINAWPTFTAIKGLEVVAVLTWVITQSLTYVRWSVAVPTTLIADPSNAADVSMRQPSTIRVCCAVETSRILPCISNAESTTWLLNKLFAPPTESPIDPLIITPPIARSDCTTPLIVI